MTDYPTLAENPDVQGFKEGPAVDPTIRSETEAGYRITRKRFTRVPKKWDFKYTQMSNADKEALATFEESVGYGSGIFNWTHPVSSTQYIVRFAELVKYDLSESDNNEWDVSVSLEEY